MLKNVKEKRFDKRVDKWKYDLSRLPDPNRKSPCDYSLMERSSEFGSKMLETLPNIPIGREVVDGVERNRTYL